ncbi:thermonuclease family protein [Lampropedia puyangensis]|nr:thermonuclease family protein [Lampropedia puyangensis]
MVAIALVGCQTAAGQSQASRAASGSMSCTIHRISDGDTVRAQCQQGSYRTQVRIRIKAIDAPELRQPYGSASRQALQRLCLRETFTLARQHERDQYGRSLLDLQCKQQDVATFMVEAGLAWAYRATAGDYPHLVAAEARAKRSGKGLWGQANPTPPWAWRHRQ